MGTDIHGFLETQWRKGARWSRECTIDRDRNYNLFAALANVRNGYGFAGVPTHEAIRPISMPRGLPADHTTGWGEEVGFEFGDHSFSWLSLEEMVKWDGWDQGLSETGWIERAQYEPWLRNGGAPEGGWCGGIEGHSVIYANHMDNVFPEGWTHVRVSWSTRTLRETCRVWLAWLGYAEAKAEGYADARVVFGFDS